MTNLQRINAEATLQWQHATVSHYRFEATGSPAFTSDSATPYYILEDVMGLYRCYIDSYEDYSDPVTKMWRDTMHDALVMLTKGWSN